jgi:hypothetical protein
MTANGETVTTPPRQYIGGPLDGQDADSAKPIYRNADGTAAPASFGDRRLMHGHWQTGESGIYTRSEGTYRWIAAPTGRTAA